MTAERYAAYEAHMRACMKDSAHDEGHIRRVAAAALLLARKEKEVDVDVLIAAALLHDIGREEQFRTGESHAVVGARMAGEFLTGRGEEEAFARQVCACIRTHSFRKDDPPATVEAKILYDADKLDVVGAIGMARTLLYQGRVGHPIYSIGPDGTVLSGEEKTPSFYSEYRHKLQSMSGRFLTAAGKRQAVIRSEAAAQFDAALQAETGAAESGPAWRILPRTADARMRRVFNMALMLAGDSGKIPRADLVEMVMRPELQGERTPAQRLIADARRLDDAGVTGVCERLIGIGHRRGRMEQIFEERPEIEYFTSQARGMARARNEAAQAYLTALRKELTEYEIAAKELCRGEK